MSDTFSKEKRSAIMSLVKSNNTSLEILVRSYLHKKGFRFRVNVKTLPGKPDIYLKKYQCIIFCHGCFWHAHEGCKRATIPKTRNEWWKEKLNKNKARDEKAIVELRDMGLNVIIIWECELSTIVKRKKRLEKLVKEIKLQSLFD